MRRHGQDPKLWGAVEGDDSVEGSRGRESAGFDGWNREFSAGMADSSLRRFLLLSRRTDDDLPAFAVIKGMECSRVNWPFPGKERSLLKKSAGERTRQNI